MAPRALSPRRLAVAACAFALAACTAPRSQQTVPAWPPLEPAELGQMHNVAVSDGMWIGSEPSETDLDLAYRRGIRRVVSLCAATECPDYDLRAACGRVGLDCFEVASEDPALLDDGCVDQALALIAEAETEGLQTLMFCPDGSRCAAVFAIHRVVREGMPLDDALLEAHRAGLRGDDEEFVRRHVARLLARQSSSG